ncbi:MAG: lipopolysaccharide transport periplasmic protein LptA [Thermodesulfobacteriota bacterium]
MRLPRLSLISCMVFALCVSACLSQASAKEEKQPTRITSRDMTYSGDSRQVVFENNVHVVRNDFELWSDKLVMHLSVKDDKAGNADEADIFSGEGSEVEKIVALKNVRVKSEDREGRCAKLVYDTRTEIITMTGDPVLFQGKNEIKGAKIVMDVKNDTSRVFSGEEKRVEAMFYSQPESEE